MLFQSVTTQTPRQSCGRWVPYSASSFGGSEINPSPLENLASRPGFCHMRTEPPATFPACDAFSSQNRWSPFGRAASKSVGEERGDGERGVAQAHRSDGPWLA